MSWALVFPGDGSAHVLPTGDLRLHSPRPCCWCRPAEDDEEADVLIHRSMDRRELYERGELKPN